MLFIETRPFFGFKSHGEEEESERASERKITAINYSPSNKKNFHRNQGFNVELYKR